MPVTAVLHISVDTQYWHMHLGKDPGLGHGGAGASPAKINTHTRGLTFLDRWTDEANLFEHG